MYTETELSDACLDILENNILPWWKKMKNPAGGFYPEADTKGKINPYAPGGAVYYSRLIWTFSAVYRALGRKDCLEMAGWAYDFFREKFFDRDNGGIFWAVSPDGMPAVSKKQLYAQAFAIYALSEYYRATGEEKVLQEALDIFNLVEKHFSDTIHKGYIEALSTDFSPLEDMSLSEKDINAAKTMNSHLHLLEAYTNLYRVHPDSHLRGRLQELLDIVTDLMLSPGNHMRLYFTEDWTPLSDEVSPGHDIEASWLAMEAALVAGGEVAGEIRPRCYEMAVAANKLLETQSSLTTEWWVAAEAVVGNIWLWRKHNDPSAYGNTCRILDIIRKDLIDNKFGEWLTRRNPDGTPDTASPKSGFWKCPYHNSRMCLEVISAVTGPETDLK